MPWSCRRHSSIRRAIVCVDKLRHAPPIIETAGLRVGALDFCAASLRYFDTAGHFAATVREAIGQPLPQPLHAAAFTAGNLQAQMILAWRSPTETLLLCTDRTTLAELERRLVVATDGCIVDQTGGVCVFRALGRRARDLLQRMGATTAVPDVSEARAGRLAELHVLTVCVQAEEFILIVERAYAEHLREWIRSTVADFA
jgi:sarcosine oxidase gamma subunit